jgi:predicted AlkP superfamily pyrophosphatase or phosphodiesterase
LDVGADVQLDVDSNNDGVINEKDDPIEEQTPGKLVPISDKQWDLAPMYISVTPSDVKGTVTLKQTGGDGKVRIFDYGSYPLGNPVFDSDLHPDGTQDLWDTMLERDWGRQKSRSRPLKAQGVQEGEVLLAMTYRAGDVVETDSVLLKVVKARRLEFVDKSGSVVEFGTSFSDPFPTVTLQDLNASSFQVTAQTEPNGKKDIVRFQVSGTIKDPLADIVADGAADIARASVTVNGVPLPDNVPFQKVNEAPTPLRPYACHWEFGPVTVYWLLSNGANTFDVSATNAMGNTGSDSLTLTVSIPDYDFVTEDGEEKIADATSMTIEGVENHDSTEQGLYNPILAKVYDPLLDPDETDGVTATFIGAEFPLRVLNASQRQYALDRPILAIVHDSANGKSNLVNLRTATTPMPVSYGGMSKGLHWAFTANSKATQYKFASGTTVDHWVYSDVFDADPAPSISAVNVLNSDNSPASRGTFNVSPTLVSPAPLSGHTRGLKLTIVIPQGAHRPSASATKDLDIVYRASGSNEDQHLPLRQNFAVVPLKIVVCAIDGAGYSTVTDVVSLPDSSNAPRYFNRAFGKALQADPSTRLNNVVLSMLPTITFCNWPSILSGRSPKDTGITGNSFFDRDNTNNSKKVFMGRGTRSDSNSYGYTVVSGHLDEWARSVAPGDSTGGTDSLYAKAADRAGGDTLRAVSINTFYRRGQRPNLKLDATVYPWWPCRRVSTYASWTVPPIALPLIIERYRDLIGHKQRVAKAFDRISATDAIQYWKCPGGALPDITTIYFPGVDTLAHRQGQPDEALNTLIKPNLFENDEYEGLLGPGANQGPFFREWTDRQFGRFLEYVEHRGLQHSILFALVADHGFIHYKTDPAHRLMVQDSNGPELLKLWEPDNAQPAPPLRLLPLFNSQDDVANCRTVYCPNGGMAQLYVRNGQNAWDQAPTDTDIKAVAEAFYWEAVGVDSRDQTGTQVVGDLHNAFGRYGQGQHPAIFVRLGGYNADYQWYIRQGNAFVPASIDTFLADVAQQGQQLDWPDFKRRMEELNEKSNLPAGSGSRSGDIILVMDCKNGYLTEPDDKEILPGWHGGPTKAESEVPLIFNFAYGSASADNQGIITTAIKSVPSFDRDLTPVLVEIVRQSRGTAP